MGAGIYPIEAVKYVIASPACGRAVVPHLCVRYRDVVRATLLEYLTRQIC